MNEAVLVLEDGSIFTGVGFGASCHEVFELVFNTSITGYQEILTDASYHGQGVVFTAPHIGNVGVNEEDYESTQPHISALVVRSLSPVVANWRATRSLDAWLEANGVPGICDVDTRYLTRKIRDQGTMKAAISTDGTESGQLLELVKNWSGLDGLDIVKEVTVPEPFHWQPDSAQKWLNSGSSQNQLLRKEDRLTIVVVDFGSKTNILRHLTALNADVVVVPASLSSSEVFAFQPDGIVLSNGPGDPAGIPYAIQHVKDFLEREIPVLGICLGHQLIGLALGARTERLKFGHHGGNHPVQDLRTCKTLVTSQNHNFVVVEDSLNSNIVEVTHISLNDHSIEGMRIKGRPVFSVQFHPEASPGPHDAFGLFSDFFQLIRKKGLTDGI